MAGEQELSHTFTNVPTIYADGVANLSRGPGVVKCFLVRFDPDPASGWSLATNTVAGQVVMSSIGFAATAIFFHKQLAQMVERGEIDRAIYDELIRTAEAL